MKLPAHAYLLLVGTVACLCSRAPVVATDENVAVAAGDDPGFVSTRVDMVGLAGQLLAPLGVLLTEAVKEMNKALPGGGVLEEGAIVGSCCEIGDVGAKLKLGLFDFEMEKLDTEKQIVVKAKPVANKAGVVGVRSHGKQLRLSSGVAATLGMAAILPFECTVDTTATLVMERYSVDFNVDLNEKADGERRFYVDQIDEGEARVEIAPKLSGSCEPVQSAVERVFELMSQRLTKSFRNVFSVRLTEIVTNQINKMIDFVLPALVDIDLGVRDLLPGRRLEVVPRLDFAATRELSTDWRASGLIEAHLDQPEWRSGRSFSYDDYAADGGESKIMPDPDLGHVFNLHVGERALNRLISTVWYAAASALTEDEALEKSPLCALAPSTPTDPCPFLPFQRSFGMLDPAYWVSFIMFPFKIFAGYDLQSLLTPPRVDFVAEGLEGSGTVSMMLRGRTGNAEIDADDESVLAILKGAYSVKGGLPGFDYDTGRFNLLRLDGVFLGDVEIEFPNCAPILGSLATLLVNVLSTATGFATSLLLTLLNDAVEETINKLPSLLLPDVKIPLLDGFLKYYLPVGGLHTVPATETEASYVQIWGDLGTRSLGKEEEEEETEGDEDGDEDYSYYGYERKRLADPEMYCETAKKWANEFNNPQATFSCIYQGKAGERQNTYRIK